MLAVGLSALISLGLAELFSVMIAISQRSHLDGAILQMMEDARMGLQRGAACARTLSVLDLKKPLPLPVDLGAIVDESGHSLISVGDVPDQALRVRKITLDMNPKGAAWTPGSVLAVDVFVEFESTKNRLLGSNFWRHRIPLSFETGVKGEVISCNSLSLTERQHLEEAVCDSLGGEMKGAICDLAKSQSITRAACKSIGLKSTSGEHCD